MEVFPWLSTHWFDLLQSVGIVGGLLFTGLSLRIDANVRRVSNQLTITAHHRDIWTQLYHRPELARVLDPTANLETEPITPGEERFVVLLVLHLKSARTAMKQGMFIAPEGLRRDILDFFSKPIPKAVWERIKYLQNEEFVEFIEATWCERATNSRYIKLPS